MRKTMFTIEVLEGEIFEGFTEGRTWNGWACPYFTFDQAQLIVDACRRQGLEAKYDQSEDQFVFTVNDSDEQDAFPATDVSGSRLYPVGAYSWIWEEVMPLAKT